MVKFVSGYEMVRRYRWRGEKSFFEGWRPGGLMTLVRRGWAYREFACRKFGKFLEKIHSFQRSIFTFKASLF